VALFLQLLLAQELMYSQEGPVYSMLQLHVYPSELPSEIIGFPPFKHGFLKALIKRFYVINK